MVQRGWIDLEGLANLRDLGGLPVAEGGAIVSGRLLRSDNLQTLTGGDVQHLLGLGLSDVVDLRSDYEVANEGPGPLAATAVAVHHFSVFREWRPVAGEGGVGEDKPDSRPEVLPELALPWVDLEPRVRLENEVAGHYVSYLLDRPDSVLGALRTIAEADGAALVHCAAGKDRTGTVVALALELVGVPRLEIVADYVASSERMQPILDRLMQSPTYVENLRGRPLSSHLTYAETMEAFLAHLDDAYGGVGPALTTMGWAEADGDRLRAKLLEP